MPSENTPSTLQRVLRGAFYTPQDVAELSYEYLSRALGDGFEYRYWIWDPCAGGGALTQPFKTKERCFLSTIGDEEVAVLADQEPLEAFQYDYLNDDVQHLNGSDIEYFHGQWKLPATLRWVLEEDPARLVILMNPPYLAASYKGQGAGASETAVKVLFSGVTQQVELATQFYLRSALHRPRLIALLNKLNITNTQKAEQVRSAVHYTLDGGFVVDSRLFGTSGDFPIGYHHFWRLGEEDIPDPVQDYTGTLDVYERV